MNQVPAGAQRSDDGKWWWDGSQWQPVEDQHGADAASAEAGHRIELDESEIPFLVELSAYSPDESGAYEYLASVGVTQEALAAEGEASA